MLGRLIVVVSMLVVCLGLPAAAQSTQSSTTADLNLRLGPGTQYGIIAVIPRGQWIQVLGCTNPVSWCQAQYANRTGWVSASYLYPRPGSAPPPAPWPTPVPPGAFPPFFPPPDFPSQPYPPSQPGGITVVGTLTNEGVECPTLRADDGRLYTLMGNLGPFGPGNRVRVRGYLPELSFCMQGVATIDVRSIQPAFY